jgi:hypothetical protein
MFPSQTSWGAGEGGQREKEIENREQLAWVGVRSGDLEKGSEKHLWSRSTHIPCSELQEAKTG